LYSAEHFHTIPLGAKNGEKQGLKLILDVETFDYAYFPRCPFYDFENVVTFWLKLKQFLHTLVLKKIASIFCNKR
jgi:hypothetical protein